MIEKMETVSYLLSKLFASYPQAPPTNEALEAYMDAVSKYEVIDIRAAIGAFLAGEAPGLSNPNFAPSAPLVGSEIRRQLNLRLDRESRERNLRPKLPAPDIERPPEAQERVKALMEKTVARLRASSLGYEAGNMEDRDD